MNHFQLFDLSPGFKVDLDDLHARYLRLQAHCHPDNFATAPRAEQAAAQQLAAQINSAYAELRSPIARAIHLLALIGYDPAEIVNQQVRDPAFLMQQMELREQLEDADQPEELQQLAQELQQQQNQLQQSFADAWHPDCVEPEQRAQLAELLAKMQYYANILQQIERQQC